MGKYFVIAKAWDRHYGMVEIRKVFTGTRKEAYENAMRYAYHKANRYKDRGTDFSVTIQGEDWLTAANVHPM